MVAVGACCPGMLETPRLSKMAWLQEWRQLLALYPHCVQELWTASCAFHSAADGHNIFYKLFRFLCVHMAPFLHGLHKTCQRNHSHTRVEGIHTSSTATYDRDLTAAIVRCFERAIQVQRAGRGILYCLVVAVNAHTLTSCFSVVSGERDVAGLGGAVGISMF